MDTRIVAEKITFYGIVFIEHILGPRLDTPALACISQRQVNEFVRVRLKIIAIGEVVCVPRFCFGANVPIAGKSILDAEERLIGWSLRLLPPIEFLPHPI